MAVNQVATLGVKVDPRGAVTGAKRARTAIQGIGKTASNVKNKILSVQGALLGLGAGAFLKSVIETKSGVESLEVRLKFLTGSVEDAQTAFKVMNEFASKVPFSLADIEKASPLLLTVADDVGELNELLAITGDIAAISGLSFDKTAEQLQRAMASGIASADLFRERGVASFLGFKNGVSSSAEETREKITSMWRNSTTTAVGATDELAKTFQGQVSMMGDAYRELKLAVADSGVFEMASKAVLALTEVLRSEETMEEMKKFGSILTSIGLAMGSVAGTLMKLPAWVLEVGVVLAFLGGKKAKAVVAVVVSIALGIDAVTKAIDDFKNAGTEEGLLSNVDKDVDRLVKLNAQIKANALALAEFERQSTMENGLSDKDAGTYFDLKKLQKGTIKRHALIKESVMEEMALVKKLQAENSPQKGLQLPMTDGEFARQQQLNDMRRNIEAALNGETKAVEDLTDAYPFLTKTTEGFWHATSIMSRGMNATGGTVDGMHGMLDVVKETTKEMEFNSIATQVMGEQYDKLAKITADAKLKQEEFALGLSDSIENSIMKMTQGLMTFKDVVKNVFQYVAAQVVRNNIANPLAKHLSSLMAGAIGGFATGTPQQAKPLMQATGGNVQGGTPYIVGERGPELFSPMGTGTITPNHRMGGGQSINVTYSPNIQALDPVTASNVIGANAPTIVNIIRQAFNENGNEVAI